MSGTPEIDVFPSRRARLEDFLDDNDRSTNSKNRNNHSQNDNISKNQQEYGHKKRIKP